MSDENEKVDLLFKKNPNSKKIKKDKFPVDIEAERRFGELKTKYANAIAFLLVKNVSRRSLQEYFEASEENKRGSDFTESGQEQPQGKDLGR